MDIPVSNSMNEILSQDFLPFDMMGISENDKKNAKFFFFEKCMGKSSLESKI